MRGRGDKRPRTQARRGRAQMGGWGAGGKWAWWGHPTGSPECPPRSWSFKTLFIVQADGYIIVLCHKGCNFSTQNHVHSLLFMEYFVMQKFYFLILNPYSFCLYAMPREYFFTPRKHKCCTHLCLVL